MPTTEGRLLSLRTGGPAENMAIDQALLESIAGMSQPILRFYTWSEPTLSLGYFQKIGDRQGHEESRHLAGVRRATGGGAIVHHHELTYSLVMPDAETLTGPRVDLYRQMHHAVVRTLSEFGIRAVPFRATGRASMEARRSKRGENADRSKNRFLCYQRRTDEDLIVCGYKVLGSAQRKTQAGVLQRGSLMLRTSPWAPQLPGIFELTSIPIPLGRFAGRLAVILGEELSIDWIAGEISAAEHRRASAIAAQKFATSQWLSRR